MRDNPVGKARKLRRQMTLPEVLLWQNLRRKPDGVKFRRQHPIGPYVLDFYCAAASLAVEVDGAAHNMGDNPERDRMRDDWLVERGIATLRIPATDILADAIAVAEGIIALCLERMGQVNACSSGPSTASRSPSP